MLAILKNYGAEYFYHFTDARNLDTIRAVGGLCSLNYLKNNDIKGVVYGGNEWSHEADSYNGGDDYVHLCFKMNHPMLFRAQQENRIDKPRWLKVKIDGLDFSRLRFTDCVANKRGARFLTDREAKDILDFEAIYTRLDFSDIDERRRVSASEKYEILVPNFIPMKIIEV